MQRRRFTTAIAAAIAWPAWVRAQAGFPGKPVRLVVAFPPGSTGDLVARMVAAKLQENMGQPVVVDNRPGATGNIAAEAVVRSPADGYTLLSTSSALAIVPWLQKMPFDVQKELLPLSQTIAGSYVLVVHPSFPARNLAEFIALVKKNPGRYSYASYGNGSGPHLAMELLKAQAGLFITHVPYRGAAPAMHDLIGGQVEMSFDTTVATLAHIRAGKIRAIALGGQATYDILPGVPTIAQTFAGFDTDGWQGIFAPAGTPREVAQKLSAEIGRAMRAPDVSGKLKDLGFKAVGSDLQAFGSYFAAEHARYGKLIAERGIKGDA
jgi:tripartite-type tricarboxylate transporter receptor subunit TctC